MTDEEIIPEFIHSPEEKGVKPFAGPDTPIVFQHKPDDPDLITLDPISEPLEEEDINPIENDSPKSPTLSMPSNDYNSSSIQSANESKDDFQLSDSAQNSERDIFSEESLGYNDFETNNRNDSQSNDTENQNQQNQNHSNLNVENNYGTIDNKQVNEDDSSKKKKRKKDYSFRDYVYDNDEFSSYNKPLNKNTSNHTSNSSSKQNSPTSSKSQSKSNSGSNSPLNSSLNTSLNLNSFSPLHSPFQTLGNLSLNTQVLTDTYHSTPPKSDIRHPFSSLERLIIVVSILAVLFTVLFIILLIQKISNVSISSPDHITKELIFQLNDWVYNYSSSCIHYNLSSSNETEENYEDPRILFLTEDEFKSIQNSEYLEIDEENQCIKRGKPSPTLFGRFIGFCDRHKAVIGYLIVYVIGLVLYLIYLFVFFKALKLLPIMTSLLKKSKGGHIYLHEAKRELYKSTGNIHSLTWKSLVYLMNNNPHITYIHLPGSEPFWVLSHRSRG